MPPSVPFSSRYRRLPGRTPTFRLVFKGSSRLWLGDDHLLQVHAGCFTETYQRYAYGDIQALLLRETACGLVMTIILGVLAASSGLLLWTAEDAPSRGFSIGLGIFLLVLFVVNLIRGKTCRCQLQTAAGPHPLRSLNRVRPARKALRLITKKIEAAQPAKPSI